MRVHLKLPNERLLEVWSVDANRLLSNFDVHCCLLIIFKQDLFSRRWFKRLV